MLYHQFWALRVETFQKLLLIILEHFTRHIDAEILSTLMARNFTIEYTNIPEGKFENTLHATLGGMCNGVQISGFPFVKFVF